METPFLEESGDRTDDGPSAVTGFFVKGCRTGMDLAAGEVDLVPVASATGRCGVGFNVKPSAASPTPSEERATASVIRRRKAFGAVFFFIVLWGDAGVEGGGRGCSTFFYAEIRLKFQENAPRLSCTQECKIWPYMVTIPPRFDRSLSGHVSSVLLVRNAWWTYLIWIVELANLNDSVRLWP